MPRVLLVAFSVCPGMGSEAGIGWNFALHLAARHDVTLITTGEFRAQIEAYLAAHPEVRMRVVYRNNFMPQWLMFRSYPRANIYYYTWHLRIIPVVRALHRRHRFDLVHHVNWGRYWMPSGGAFAGAPFVWGPVGAAEGHASPLTRGMSLRGRLGERVRDFMRWLFENDPLTGMTARNASAVIAATRETAEHIRRKWGVEGIDIISSVGIAAEDLPDSHDQKVERFDHACISIGRLLDWKGFHLGLRAFAAAKLGPDARFAIVGEGPEEPRLRRLVAELGIAGRVDFLGQIPRKQVLETLRRSRMLVHPSLHDSGGFVLVEAMALGRPVVCLDIGGPAVIVDEHSGIKVRAPDAESAVEKLRDAIERLCGDQTLYESLSRGAAERGHGQFLWSRKMDQIDAVYHRVLGTAASNAAASTVAPRGDADAQTLLRVKSTEKSRNLVA